MKTKTRNVITATVISAVTLSMAGPALATGPITVPVPKGECLLEIATSINELDTAATDLGASPTVTDAHRAQLEEILAYAENGLTGVQATVSATSSTHIINDLCRTYENDYPVDGLIIPQVEITILADQISADEAVVIDPDDTFLMAADAASIAGADMTEAIELYEHSMIEFTQAFELIDGVADSVLGVTPSYFEFGLGSAYVSMAQSDSIASMRHWRSGWSLYDAAYVAYDRALATL